MIVEYTVDINLTSEDLEFMREYCKKYNRTERIICEEAVVEWLDYLRNCEIVLSTEKVDGCKIIKEVSDD